MQETEVELFANLSVGKVINWPFPQHLLNGRTGFGNLDVGECSVCTGKRLLISSSLRESFEEEEIFESGL